MNLVLKQAMEHESAELSPVTRQNGYSTQVCSGCGNEFQVGQGQRHIAMMKGGALAHQYVEALLVNQFALTRSEPTIFNREVIAVGPVTSQVAQMVSPRKRRRHRRRKHGNGD